MHVSRGYGAAVSRLPHAVLLDFSGTLFHVETARAALVAALGEPFAHLAPELERWGAINGSGTSPGLPPSLADAWERRDLSARAHRAAYSGLGMHAGLSAEQAHVVYERGLTPQAWRPYSDTLPTLRRLHRSAVPVALVSNIGWDPRPVLRAYGADRYLQHLVLSDERGVIKPDPAIFRLACQELGVAPRGTLMVGDNPVADGGATAIGCRFVLVPSSPTRRDDALLRAVGLALDRA
jgi:putative hydrolase of the HAD superfamily